MMMLMMKWPIFFLLIVLVACEKQRPIALENLPADLPQVDILFHDIDFKGHIFLRKIISPGAMIMINHLGSVVWFQESDTALNRVFRPYAKSYVALDSDRDLVEITYEGDTLTHLKFGVGGFDRKLHHEVVKDTDNHYVALTREILPINLLAHGGQEADTIRYDGIIKLSANGKKLWSWKLSDHLNPLDGQHVLEHRFDWGHANALEIDRDGNYLISFRDFNEIWKIDSESGVVIWKYGAHSIEDPEHRFYGQHAINLSSSGDFLMFDNGNIKNRKMSRALAFREQNQKFMNTLIIELPDSLFSWKQGSVYQVGEDRFLLNSSMRKKIAITNGSGELLWMAATDHEFYRAYYLDESTY